MPKFGGRPGGAGGGMNMGNLVKQAQKMQKDMEALREELKTREYSASSGGGAVNATVSGENQIIALSISPDIVDVSDMEMLEDLVRAAVNEALRAAAAASEGEMAKLTGGMGGIMP